MCMFCNWGDELADEDEVDPEAYEARRRASLESWARLMDEIAEYEAARTASPKAEQD